MSARIEITAVQAQALVELAGRQDSLAIRQLASDERASAGDHATPHGSSIGYRIAADGAVSEIGETLPAFG